MDPMNIPPMLAYIPAPWILWEWDCLGDLMGYIYMEFRGIAMGVTVMELNGLS
jgi:hypothetical protein